MTRLKRFFFGTRVQVIAILVLALLALGIIREPTVEPEPLGVIRTHVAEPEPWHRHIEEARLTPPRRTVPVDSGASSLTSGRNKFWNPATLKMESLSESGVYVALV